MRLWWRTSLSNYHAAPNPKKREQRAHPDHWTERVFILYKFLYSFSKPKVNYVIYYIFNLKTSSADSIRLFVAKSKPAEQGVRRFVCSLLSAIVLAEPPWPAIYCIASSWSSACESAKVLSRHHEPAISAQQPGRGTALLPPPRLHCLRPSNGKNPVPAF